MKTEENKTKSRYTKEFQDSMVKLVAESNEPISKIATDVGINKKTLYGWIMKEKSSKIQLDKTQELTFLRFICGGFSLEFSCIESK